MDPVKVVIVSKYRSANDYLKTTLQNINYSCTIFMSDFQRDTPYGNYLNGNPVHFYTQDEGLENHMKVYNSTPIHYVYNFQRAFESAKEIPEDHYFILLEDDLDFTENWIEKTIKVLNQIEDEEFILNLYSPYDYETDSDFVEYDIENNYNKHYGCQATVWKKKTAVDFAKFNRAINFNDYRIQNDSIIFQMDHLMAIYADYKGIPIYTTVPSLVQHIGFKTTGVAQFMHQSPTFKKN